MKNKNINTRKDFLSKSDINILDYEISEAYFEGGTQSTCVLFRVGESEKDIQKMLESIPKEELDKSNHISLPIKDYEIMFTKDELEFMLDQINKYEKGEEGEFDYDTNY